MAVVGDRIGPTSARIHSAQFGYLKRLFALLAACLLGLSGASVAAANGRRAANAHPSANPRPRTELSHRKRAKPSGAGRFKRPAILSSAERSDFDQVNVDRLESRVGLLKSSAVLEAIANKRVHQMARRHSDYAGYDIRVNLRQEKLCVKGGREIEDQLQGGGGSYPSIELNPRWTVFAVAIYSDPSGTYTVEDYAAPCGLKPPKPIRLPKGSLSLDGLAVSAGPPASSARLYPMYSTITSLVACNPQAGLYAVVRYSGPKNGSIDGTGIGNTILPIDQPAARGRNAVLLAKNLVTGSYGFGLEAAGRIRLPDGDRAAIPISQVGIGAKEAVTLNLSC
jgi:hypothetical protein